MNKPDLSKMGKTLLFTLEKRSPEILTGMGISSMFVAIGTAISATKKATRRIDELEEVSETPLTKTEVVKGTWKFYIPTAATAAFSVACILGANSEQAKRNAALATAYKLSETAFTEYKAQVVETIGDKKEKVIEEKAAQKQTERTVYVEDVYHTGTGNILYLEPTTKRLFRASEQYVKRVENIINQRMRNEMFISLNELHWEIGMEGVDECVGDMMGWDIDKGMVDIDFIPITAHTGEPCHMLTYTPKPEYKY